MSNTLQWLINQYPDKPWSVSRLIRNRSIDYKFITSHKYIKWGNLLQNPTLSADDIYHILSSNHMNDIYSSYNLILRNENITTYEARGIISMFHYDITQIPIIKKVMKYNGDSEINDKNIDDYDINSILSNMPWSKLRPHIIRNYSRYIESNGKIKYKYRSYIYSNPSITIDILSSDSIFKDVDYDHYSSNVNVTIDFALTYNKYVNPDKLACNHSISLEDISAYGDIFNWNYNIILAGRRDLTISFLQYLDEYKLYDWYKFPQLLANPSFTIDDIEWIFRTVKINIVSQNPNITPEFIKKYEDIINWNDLSSNKFELSECYKLAASIRKNRELNTKYRIDILISYLPLVLCNLICKYERFI